MPPRNDPVLDSGFPQEDHPARTGKLFPSALIWAGPLGVAVTLLLDMVDVPDTGFPACTSCRVMWRSEAARRPEVEFSDFD